MINEWFSMAFGFTMIFLGLWGSMYFIVGYDYFMAWKNMILAIIMSLWIITMFRYIIFDCKLTGKIFHKLREENE